MNAPAISTHSQDCARGLDHPIFMKAREMRIAVFARAETERQRNFNSALLLIRQNIKTEAELVNLLHCAGSALAKRYPHDGLIQESIQLIDEVADQIEDRGKL